MDSFQEVQHGESLIPPRPEDVLIDVVLIAAVVVSITDVDRLVVPRVIFNLDVELGPVLK